MMITIIIKVIINNVINRICYQLYESPSRHVGTRVEEMKTDLAKLHEMEDSSSPKCNFTVLEC